MRTNGQAKLAPTLLCADPLQLGAAIETFDGLDIAWHHVDVMDGHFVPNLAFGMDALRAICRAAKKPVCVHLMVEEPASYVQRLADQGASCFVFHLEAESAPFRLIRAVHDAGMQAGIALSPATDVEALRPLLSLLDMALIMAVEPGFSGQSFLPHTPEKISALRRMAKALRPGLCIEVDGGLDDSNGHACQQCGADVLVGGVFTLFRQGATLEENFARSTRALKGGAEWS
ncbi:MAG TPA: ribulose-phosphate 3-epimerase [Clostridia bacterium]|nr:ribulose-phosphate 3-epimerase [Clostridia bacterium]